MNLAPLTALLFNLIFSASYGVHADALETWTTCQNTAEQAAVQAREAEEFLPKGSVGVSSTGSAALVNPGYFERLELYAVATALQAGRKGLATQIEKYLVVIEPNVRSGCQVVGTFADGARSSTPVSGVEAYKSIAVSMAKLETKKYFSGSVDANPPILLSRGVEGFSTLTLMAVTTKVGRSDFATFLVVFPAARIFFGTREFGR